MNRQAMQDHIDAKAGAVRAQYITIAPGQGETYLLEEAQAKAFAASMYQGPVPGMVQVEMDSTGMDAQSATNSIIQTSAAWTGLAEMIEGIRLTGKRKIAAAIDDAQAEADYQQAIQALIGLFPPAV